MRLFVLPLLLGIGISVLFTTQVFGQAAPSDGLIAHWKFDESSGSTATERISGYHGTLNESVAFAPSSGHIEGAAYFDGSDACIAVPTFDIDAPGLSISAWVRVLDVRSSNNREGRIISKASDTAPRDHIWALTLNDDRTFRFRLTAGDRTWELETPKNSIALRQWQLITATYDGVRQRLYLDGKLVAEQDASGPIAQAPSVPVAIGNQPSGAGRRSLNGYLDDLRIYGRALTDTEISQMARNGLIAHYTLNENGGRVAHDTVNNYNGVLISGAELNPGAGRTPNSGALILDGDDDAVEVDAFDITGNELTISSWIYLTGISSTNDDDEGRIISKATSTNPDDHFWMLGLKDGDKLRGRLKTSAASSTATIVSSPNAIGLNRWTHVAMTYDGTNVTLYVDGVVVGTTELTGTIVAAPDVNIGIGNQPLGAGARGLDGRIEQVRIYSTALSQTELTNRMSAANLPVTWESFTATATRHGQVRLRWRVSEQIDNRGFTIERRTDTEAAFRPVGFVAAHTDNTYAFLDPSPSASTIYYRLRQEDYDGSSSYSAITVIHAEGTPTAAPYPNPATDRLHVPSAGSYRIYDSKGQLVQTGTASSSNQAIALQLPRPGIYLLRTQQRTYRFTKL